MPAIVDKADAIAKVDRIIAKLDSKKLVPGPDVKDEMLREALDEYSNASPRKITFQTPGSSTTKRYVLATLTAGANVWVDEVSQLERVIKAIKPDTDDELEEPYKNDEFSLRVDTAGADVLFLTRAVGASDTLRLIYTRPHEINGLDGATVTTVSAKDSDALALLAASKVASWISRAASDDANQTTGIDQVEFKDIHERWRDRAEELRKDAIERLSPSMLSAGAAGTSIDWERKTALGNVERIAH